MITDLLGIHLGFWGDALVTALGWALFFLPTYISSHKRADNAKLVLAFNAIGVLCLDIGVRFIKGDSNSLWQIVLYVLAGIAWVIALILSFRGNRR